MIYFDNAATTYPKPPSVYRAVRECMEDYCANPGRSNHSLSLLAAKKVYECRCKTAELFGCSSEENVIFTLNTTYALNIAIKSLIRQGDHIIISDLEHNSVIRPIIASGCDYSIFKSEGCCDDVIHGIETLITPKTAMIVSNHQSNICPRKNPISAIGRLCRKKGLLFVVDCAQSAGIYNINIKELSASALCFAGHKGLYGIQGTGGVVFSDSFKGLLAHNLHTLIEGGNGINSLDGYMPQFLPERLEAGTLPTPAIAGLCEGIKEINRIGICHIRQHQEALYKRLLDYLLNEERITLYCPDHRAGHTLLFNTDCMSPGELASALDSKGICVRSGFHCAPLAHQALKTGGNGAVRVSFSAFNTLEEVDRFSDTLHKIIKSTP